MDHKLDKNKVQEILAPHGWKIKATTVSVDTGFTQLVFVAKSDNKGSRKLMTILRSGWGGKIAVDISCARLRDGFVGQWLEDLGGFPPKTFDSIRQALRYAGRFISDNPGIEASQIHESGYKSMSKIYQLLATPAIARF